MSGIHELEGVALACTSTNLQLSLLENDIHAFLMIFIAVSFFSFFYPPPAPEAQFSLGNLSCFAVADPHDTGGGGGGGILPWGSFHPRGEKSLFSDLNFNIWPCM